tara:strand:+ start:430 stop:897 length:468 start_codon:yes stop_codon:yes gene_type:complete
MITTRGKGKIGKCLGLSDAYKEFKKTSNKNSHFAVDYSLYKSICADFNKKIVHHILEDSGTFKVPHRLGEIRIQKKKMNFTIPNKLMVDWKRTNELGTRVYHLNDHTDNFRYKWYWRKSKAIVKNKTAYSFTATRENMRALASNLITRKGIDYFE